MISMKNTYYLTSFVAGGVLMAMEILIAKLIGPYFGGSLYVWAATIGTTLIGLATGYYFSGILCKKENLKNILLKITIITAIFISILPWFSGFIMNLFIASEVKTGIILSTLIFNFPLFFLFGLYSPIIINLLTVDISNSGSVAGKIYGISTISGVFFMLILAVFVLPKIGMYLPVYICAFLMLIIAGLQFLNLNTNEK